MRSDETVGLTVKGLLTVARLSELRVCTEPLVLARHQSDPPGLVHGAEQFGPWG